MTNLVGYSIGNFISLWALRLVDASVEFAPVDPYANLFDATLVEAIVFVSFQSFYYIVSRNQQANALWCSFIVFYFLDVTGAYVS